MRNVNISRLLEKIEIHKANEEFHRKKNKTTSEKGIRKTGDPELAQEID